MGIAKILEDGRLDKFVSDRYKSYQYGIGADIVAGRAHLESLEQYALGLKQVKIESVRQEYLESIVNEIIFSL